MRQVAVDTAKFVQKLVLSQVPEKQARAHVEVALDIMKMNLDGLATQIDIHRLESQADKQGLATQAEIKRLESKIEQQGQTTQAELQRLESKIEQQGQTTQAEIQRLESKFEAKLELKIQDVQHSIKETESRLDAKIENLNSRLTLLYRMLNLLLAAVGSSIAAVFPFIFKLYFP